ncbi:MAG: GNAT family N-acetyltransferase [Pseudomonadota bacterium]
MAADPAAVREIEEALVGHWSHLGRWPKGALVEEHGTLRYETPIPSLPYNGVIRTTIIGDPDEVVADVLDTFRRRDVECLWWVHPSALPGDLGRRLAANGLSAVERVTGMAIELDDWRPQPTPPDVRYEPVETDEALGAYADLIVAYWDVPDESRALVEEVNAYWGPRSAPVHRWLALVEGQPVGKVLLSLAAPEGIAAIYGMSVRPELRGRGIAGGLTTVALGRARDLGCRRVVLHSSELAVGVYERAGFAKVCPLTVYANAPIWTSRHR